MPEDVIMTRKILIVDDEADTRAELAEYLEGKGYHVEETADGLDALEKFEAVPADLVITDMKMPRLDGYELIRRIRKIDTRVPVIAMTGSYSATDLGRAKKAGASLTMKKPIRLRELRQKLKTLLEADDE